MKARLIPIILLLLFFGIQPSYGQKLESAKLWMRGYQGNGTFGSSGRLKAAWAQRVLNVVYDNDSLFVLHYGPAYPDSIYDLPTSTNSCTQSTICGGAVGPCLECWYRESFGYLVYNPNLDSLAGRRFDISRLGEYLPGHSPAGLDLISSTFNRGYTPRIRRSKMGLISLSERNGEIDSSGTYTGKHEYFFQYYRQGMPDKSYKLDPLPSGLAGKALYDMLVCPNGNILVTGNLDAPGGRDLFTAGYSPLGKLLWAKQIKQPDNQLFQYQELDKFGNINITVEDTLYYVKAYVLDTNGNLRKIVDFKLRDYYNFGNKPKAKRLANGGFAVSGQDSLGFLTDSNGITTHMVTNSRNITWDAIGAGIGNFHSAFNELYPLEDGGVVYVKSSRSSFNWPDNLDSLVKVDGNTGQVLWKIALYNKQFWGWHDKQVNPWVWAVTSSPNGDLYIGGMAQEEVLDIGYSFLYHISNVGHIYDPIPQASPTANKPLWQERKAQLSIFPNPSRKGEAFTYSLPADKANGALEIFSADGRRVYTQTFTQTSGSVALPAHLQSGLYLVRAGGLEAKWVVE